MRSPRRQRREEAEAAAKHEVSEDKESDAEEVEAAAGHEDDSLSGKEDEWQIGSADCYYDNLAEGSDDNSFPCQAGEDAGDANERYLDEAWQSSAVVQHRSS